MGVLILTHRRLLVQPVHARPDDRGLRRPASRRRSRTGRSRCAATRSRSRPTRGSRATSTRSRGAPTSSSSATRRTRRSARRPAQRSAASPSPIYIGMTATEQLIAKQVSDVFPASVDDLPLGDAARRGLIAPLRCLRVPPAAADLVGADRRRRLRPGDPGQVLDHVGHQPGRREPLPRPLRRDARDRLRGRRRPRLQPRARVPRRRPQGRGRQRQDAAAQAGRDAGRLRARRDQRPHQRAAARGGLELAARDGLHAPRADREPARLPAADRPDHAHAPAQGGRHRRRLRRPDAATHNERTITIHSPARLRLLPAGRAGDPGTAPARPAARPPQALAGVRGSSRSRPTRAAASR